MKGIKNKITLKLAHFLIRGTVDITACTGERGSIEMLGFKVASCEDDELIFANLNDGGSDSKKIHGACIEVYAVYKEVGNDAPDAIRHERYVYSKVLGEVSRTVRKQCGL